MLSFPLSSRLRFPVFILSLYSVPSFFSLSVILLLLFFSLFTLIFFFLSLFFYSNRSAVSVHVSSLLSLFLLTLPFFLPCFSFLLLALCYFLTLFSFSFHFWLLFFFLHCCFFSLLSLFLFYPLVFFIGFLLFLSFSLFLKSSLSAVPSPYTPLFPLPFSLFILCGEEYKRELR